MEATIHRVVKSTDRVRVVHADGDVTEVTLGDLAFSQLGRDVSEALHNFLFSLPAVQTAGREAGARIESL